jgi:hypothetical protein
MLFLQQSSSPTTIAPDTSLSQSSACWYYGPVLPASRCNEEAKYDSSGVCLDGRLLRILAAASTFWIHFLL